MKIKKKILSVSIITFILLTLAFTFDSQAPVFASAVSADDGHGGTEYWIPFHNRNRAGQPDEAGGLFPSYIWAAGCSPTATSMVLGYYDNYGQWDNTDYGGSSGHGKFTSWGNLIGYYKDSECIQSIPSANDGVNFRTRSNHEYSPDLLIELALAMETRGDDGGTSRSMYEPGTNQVTSAKEYGDWGQWYATGSILYPTRWNKLTDEIDAGRPCVWSMNHWGDGHGVAVWGYIEGGTYDKYVILYDTWSHLKREWPIDSDDDWTSSNGVLAVDPQGGNYQQDIYYFSPQSGVFNKGDDVVIEWLQWGTEIDNVWLRYSTNGGCSWSSISSWESSSEGWNSYTWKIPDADTIISDRVKIKIRAYDGPSLLLAGDGNKTNLTITDESLPDFIIESIALSPNNPEVGENVVATVTAKNQGEAGGNASYLDVWYDQPQPVEPGDSSYDGYCTAGWLDPGQTKTCTFEFEASEPEGLKTFRAFVNSVHATQESNYDNNQLTKSYTVASLPDFIIDSISLSPNNPEVGEEVAATVTAKNQGEAGGNASWLDVWYDQLKPVNPGTWGNDYCNAGWLNPGETTTCTFEFDAPGPEGLKTFRAFVNSDHVTPESNYDNNQLTESYTVTDQTYPGAPSVTTLDATKIGQSSATLNGLVNPEGQSTLAWFRYGPPLFPKLWKETEQEKIDGSNDIHVSHTISDLPCGESFQFRVVAQNSSGTGFGDPKPFTTAACPTYYRLSVNSQGAKGVPVKSQSGHDGYTHYSITDLALGTKVHLEAPGFVGSGPERKIFSNWSGCVNSTSRSINFEMNADKTCLVTYIEEEVEESRVLPGVLMLLLDDDEN